jgi:GxxExxY protein
MSKFGVMEKSDIRVLGIGSVGCRMRGVGLSTNRRTNYRINSSDRLTYPVISAAMRGHNRLGPGLKEAVYQNALSIEMQNTGLSFVAEQTVGIADDGKYLGLVYLDHLVEDELVVEEKAFSHLLTNEEVAQVITYLCATGKSVGLLLNFGRKLLEYRRVFAPTNIAPWRDRIKRYVWVPPEHRFVSSVSSFVDSDHPTNSQPPEVRTT